METALAQSNPFFLNFFGAAEIIVIMLVVLIFFGADKIPTFARGLGRGIRQFKDAASDIQRDIENSVNAQEISRKVEEIQDDLKPPKDPEP